MCYLNYYMRKDDKMKATSSVAPATYTIELFADGTCDIIFATHVIPIEIPSSETEETEIYYEFDMYRMHASYSDALKERIGENYSAWLDKAKNDELVAIANSKLGEMNTACRETIYAGIDVKTEYGDEHFSLNTHDQQNLSSIKMIIASGADSYPYHADGKACVLYSATDLNNIITTATKFITYQTTYCNMLRLWIERETDSDTINSIYYGCELPEDLQEYMEELI